LKGFLRILAGFLFIGSVYGFIILQQSPDSGSGKFVPVVAMAVGAFICAIFSTGEKSKYDATQKNWPLWKLLLLMISCLGFAAYYFLFANKP
jgi:hypothetical protein